MKDLNNLSAIYLQQIAESAVPGKPAEKLGAVTAIPKSEQDAARQRTLAKSAAIRAKKGIKEATKAKPDYLDFDGDGNTKESMKKALKDKAKQKVQETKKFDEVYDSFKDQDMDGDNDFADVRIARMIASGVPKEKAIAMTKNKPYNLKPKTKKEGYSNWRDDLREVVDDIQDSKEIKEKKIKNKIKINPEFKEAIENLGGQLIEMVEITEKARGTKPKSTVHAYDVDETLFSHGKKGKPNVQVHVKDSSGKRVQSLSNQEFNTHKLPKGHSYDFSEFQSAKKFKETSSPNKKVIKHLQSKVKRGENVHLVTARSKFDDPKEFHGHLKKHGINIPMKNIHYTGGMKGADIGDKKVTVAKAIAKKSGTQNIHMYDDAAKVHKSFEAEKPTSAKIKTHLIKPDEKGQSRVRSYQATKEEFEFVERVLDAAETREKERLVKGMKKNLASFRKKYGERAKEVMYATATKKAKEHMDTSKSDRRYGVEEAAAVATQQNAPTPQTPMQSAQTQQQKTAAQKAKAAKIAILQKELQATRSTPAGVPTSSFGT